jgi:hypothetical protein
MKKCAWASTRDYVRRFARRGCHFAGWAAGVLAAVVAGAAPAFGAACTARSGSGTAALVELYTSQGCSSCPPADRWFSTLGGRYAAARVVPLSLHVDYWDYLGWKDPYAQRRFSERQRKLSVLQRMALVYTPQVVLQGRDFRAWNSAQFDEAVKRINATPAAASLSLVLRSSTAAGLVVDAEAQVLAAADIPDAGLYLAAYQNRLASQVSAGENAGRRLEHDHVVLEWQGPFATAGDGRLAASRRLALVPTATPETSGVAAFVQNRRTGAVLQALLLPVCSP